MGITFVSWIFKFFFILPLWFQLSSSSSSSSSLHPLIVDSKAIHQNYTAISEFRVLNRKRLRKCSNPSPYLNVNVSSNSKLSNEEYVTVTVSGVLDPSEHDWVAMISPSHSELVISVYFLFCHYPVKAMHMNEDPDYLNCTKKECKQYGEAGECEVTTCSGSLQFHVINIRTDIEFVFFGDGFITPCIFARSNPINFANTNSPLYGHLSSIDSTATSMKLTWVSGNKKPQKVQYANGKTQISNVSTFSQKNMCSFIPASPAKDFGWHDPGFIHSALLTELQPSTNFSYRYGSDSVGWSDEIQFRTPPVGGSEELKFLAFGDMGKAPLDKSAEHYIQPGSISVINAMADEVKHGNVDSVFHIGDISYATGFLVEWDYFLNLISPVASRVTYMTAIGNHERDYIGTGSIYITPDSGGECGVPYETYFPMPTPAKDKPWYSIEQGSVHFTIISTEHEWSKNSEQYEWMKKDMASINRSKTPWLIFTGHRPMYSSTSGLTNIDQRFVDQVEPLLLQNKVDLVLFGHVHNYERTCSIYNGECKGMPTKDKKGIDVYDHSNYTAPVHAVIGMAGFTLDKFDLKNDWSISRISEFGYFRGHATKEELKLEFVNSGTRKVEDSFRITRKKKSTNRKINIGE
ncbi:hypothetical protein FNV43_RR20206 [Rhamnella rubrinervis]|uniref:Purple acid phosphatase n=1 Tax=Rhamnella rubrinervis TaxID=2594499 RepID=A0A8K0DYB1_9ROSA|nr:hypothetical protein FNV43_RR20206 [Rhamnella rubrinervis]